MKDNKQQEEGLSSKALTKIKEFSLTSFSVDNRTSVLILMGIIFFAGLMAYRAMPKEQYPEINQPTVYVGIPYPGNAPLDIENQITREVEKEISQINGIDNIKSYCVQDYTTTVVEFNFDVDVNDALQEVKDAVDRAEGNFPSDFDQQANIFKLDFSEIPVITVNLSSNSLSLDELKGFGEYLQDEFEALREISEVEINGVQEQEVLIALDPKRMNDVGLTFYDVEQAIGRENITISAGDLLTGGLRRTVRIVGEFSEAEAFGDIIVKSEFQKTVYLRDIADIDLQYMDNTSYARIDGSNVVSLAVKKKTGENLISAVDKINQIISSYTSSADYLESLDITTTADTSRVTKSQVANLENSIISGVILVVLVLLFFLGLRNAFFVGIAIPLSMLMGFLILSLMGVTMNVVVLFALILALGMLVDNGIVVVENIYRLMADGKPPIQAAKQGVGEVAWPIITSTATTLAAFFPMIFWQGMMGEFMKYLPITLIIVLTSSLFVALVINPVLTSLFMKIERREDKRTIWSKKWTILGFGVVGILLHLYAANGMHADQAPNGRTFANLALLVSLFTLLNTLVLRPLSLGFQYTVLPFLERKYEALIAFVLKGWMPYLTLTGMFLLFVGSGVLLQLRQPNIIFFPEPEPNMVNVFIEFPTGTDIDKTDSLAQLVEEEIMVALAPHNNVIEAVLTNVGEGTSDPGDPNSATQQSASPNKAKITISFVEFADRYVPKLDSAGQVVQSQGDTVYHWISTRSILEEVRRIVYGHPGVQITVDKEASGPPAGPPISISFVGEDFDNLIALQKEAKKIILNAGIQGIEELKSDLDIGKPELLIEVDRDAARRFGLSTAQIGSNLRTALFGKDVGKFKDGEDDYQVTLRFSDEYRYDREALLDQTITFRDQSDGKVKSIPIRSVVKDLTFSSTYGSVRRKDQKRQITLYSNVLDGYNANNIMQEIEATLDQELEVPNGYLVDFTGEQQEQQESMEFLSTALLIAVVSIFLIIVAQFNSIAAPIIIMLSVLFSLIGVFLGLAITGEDFSVMMTMIGIISLAGIVVNNAIVLIDYTNLLRNRRKRDLALEKTARLSDRDIKQAIIEAGRTRLRPVLLTAITTILGLIPLAIGFNINFYTLLSDINPQIYLGGDNVDFWGPMSRAVIYGLVFATFLTLVVVPTMVLLFDRLGARLQRLTK